MNLSRLDLNLLVVFDAVMQERSVTRAAQRVGLTQPAVSNALNRLRHLLKDELFLRTPEGMKPTPRAIEFAGPVREALSRIETALDPIDFVPAESTRCFGFAMSDIVAVLLLPPLLGRLQREAPGIDVRVRPNIPGKVFEMLDSGDIDFAIGAWHDPPPRFGSRLVAEDRHVCVMRSGNPLAGAPLTVEAYAAAQHLVLSLSGDAGDPVDKALALHGVQRRIAITVNQFMVVPRLLTETDLVVTMSERLARLAQRDRDLVVLPPPVELPALRLQLLWHERLASHPAHHWMRGLLAELEDQARAEGG